jgi:4-amino-4-deoxy-L-arabinose transferase-like glycosyltransferase
MKDEPTVLDYVKALLTPWRGAPPPIPPAEPDLDLDNSYEPGLVLETNNEPLISQVDEIHLDTTEGIRVGTITMPWRALIAFCLAIIAQLSLEPGPGRTWGLGLGLYIIAAAWVVWANFKEEWILPSYPAVMKKIDTLEVRWAYLILGAIFTFVAFLTLGGNRYSSINVLFWICAIVMISLGFWLPPRGSARSLLSRIKQFSVDREWDFQVSRWTFVLLAAGLIVIFFRVYRLWQVPPEMVSDHAEKLLDVWDVLHGQTSIFFPRNTGREGFQMYLTAVIIKLFGTGYSFNSLKLGTVLAGLFTLPFIYLLGVELANKRAGLIALLFAGIAYWPNVISRIGLRFSLYPLFVAPTLYFLIRGLRHSNRNDFIFAGLFLGLGLHGYTPFRIVPVVVLVGVGLYLLHSQSRGFRTQTAVYLLILILVSLVVFLPLLRFWIENPNVFEYRAFSRLGTIESPLPGPAWRVFLSNLINAMTMFAWSNGEIWPVSIPYRPALDVLCAALFYLGFLLIVVRYIRRRNWLDLFLVLSIPLLLMPSILSLAFPSENPTLNRTAGALVPVFLIVGLSLDGFFSGIESRLVNSFGKGAVWVVGIFLLIWSGYQNYDLVFNQYQSNYAQSSWNTSEIGKVIRDFSDTIGSQENAYVLAYPYWVDTRLVGINAGFPTRDFAIWPEDLPITLDNQGPKMFVVKFDDADGMTALKNLYPQGILQHYISEIPGKDFYQFYVLPE